MSTLGQKPATQHVSLQKQTITGDGGTSYTLQQSVGSALDVAVFINNTRQEPTTAYSASGTTLTMTGAVNSSDHFYVIFLGKAITTTGLPVDAVATTNINSSAITEAKIANTAITNAKIANSTIDLTSKVTGILPAANGGTGASTFTGGKTLAVTKFTNSTRTVLPAQDAYDFFDTNVTQVKASSKFLVHVHLIGWQDYSGIINMDLTYDGTTHSGSAIHVYTAQDYGHTLTGLYYIDGASSTGAKNFKFSFDHGASTGKPFVVWNPTSSDDSRLGSTTTSTIIFIEYDF